ncbi:glycosyl transferase [Brachyspira hampsonii 30446]|uniref:Glycosyl transferase n=1 Tax=Brachyspira hampsonii 30446 TaxID=1289135 RepID=A0A2U4FMG7_9SPIR|nr:glycosyl transferase [Brachyspira hampsonii]EKV56323.1 glycosyl transferase [Brachyspira hampsonii 30446]OEJ20733.1 hypothetical protein A9495_10490 [Brachyspira hampsonii]
MGKINCLFLITIHVNNVEKYLKMYINSIINHTFTKFKTIVIDYYSNSNCKETINLYNDNKIIYRYEQNKGTLLTGKTERLEEKKVSFYIAANNIYNNSLLNEKIKHNLYDNFFKSDIVKKASIYIYYTHIILSNNIIKYLISLYFLKTYKDIYDELYNYYLKTEKKLKDINNKLLTYLFSIILYIFYTNIIIFSININAKNTSEFNFVIKKRV